MILILKMKKLSLGRVDKLLEVTQLVSAKPGFLNCLLHPLSLAGWRESVHHQGRSARYCLSLGDNRDGCSGLWSGNVMPASSLHPLYQGCGAQLFELCTAQTLLPK